MLYSGIIVMLGNTILLLLLVVGLGLKSISGTFVEALEICLDSKCDVKIGMKFCMDTKMGKNFTLMPLANNQKTHALLFYY